MGKEIEQEIREGKHGMANGLTFRKCEDCNRDSKARDAALNKRIDDLILRVGLLGKRVDKAAQQFAEMKAFTRKLQRPPDEEQKTQGTQPGQ